MCMDPVNSKNSKMMIKSADSLLEATIEHKESLLVVPSSAEQFAEFPVTCVAKPHFYGL